MATVIDDIRLVKCPACDSKVDEQRLARLGITNEELSILKSHRKDETFGKFLQIVDLTMKRMDPEKLATESEMKKTTIQLQKTVDGVLAALKGTAIGKIGETITVKELKSAFPQDDFSDENANKGDTDIVATVIEGGKEKVKICISCKYVDKWSGSFIFQLQKNMKQEKTDYGILVTKSFPSDSLNDRVHYLEKEKIMMVKPEFLSVAYGGSRREVLAWDATRHYIKNQQQNEKEFSKSIKIITKWLNDRTNPVLKSIEICKKLSSNKEDRNKKFLKYVTTYENDMKKDDDSILDELDLITDAMGNLDQVLKNEKAIK
jgi:hypothetical protein